MYPKLDNKSSENNEVSHSNPYKCTRNSTIKVPKITKFPIVTSPALNLNRQKRLKINEVIPKSSGIFRRIFRGYLRLFTSVYISEDFYMMRYRTDKVLYIVRKLLKFSIQWSKKYSFKLKCAGMRERESGGSFF